MGEAAAAAAAERMKVAMHRRVEFHAATTRPQPHVAAAGGAGGFRVETLRQGADTRRVAAAAGAARGDGREKGEAGGSGFDRELAAARVYLRRIGAGLRNLGNTCYLNSVLQCLTYTEPFVAYLHSGKHKSSSCRTAGFCALCALQNHVRSALQSTGKIVTPVQFVKNLRCISRSFRNSRQEDAHELMVNLLESMHKCCLPSGIPSQSPSAYENSLVHRIFGGRLRSQVRCDSCSHCSSKFDPFLDLSLEIANAGTLREALQNFTKEEVLDGGEKEYNCQSCKTKVVAKKRFTIDKAPDVLTIHLKRFSPFNPGQKIDKKVDFQPTLNLKPFVSNSEGMDFQYSLYGVLVHAGWNTQSGHYYCFVRTSSGIWHNLDDKQVRQVREADVLRQKAYMLFYVRDRVRSTGMFKHSASNFLANNSIPEKIACMNGSTGNSLMKATLNVSSFINGDVKSQKQNSDNGHPTIFGNSSRGQCSKNSSSTEVMQSASVQNSDLISVKKALCIQPDAVATLSINTNKVASDSLDMGKVAASAQEVKTKDTTGPDETMFSSEGLTCCGEAKETVESVKQHDAIVMDKELSAEHTDPAANTIEQGSAQNNNLEAVQVNSEKHICSEDSPQAICSEVSVQAICSEVSAQAICSEVPARVICSEVPARVICSEVSAQAICSEVSAQAICSEVSAQAISSEVSAQAISSEVSAQAICSEVSAQLFDKVPCHDSVHTKTYLKSKKHVACSTAHLLFASKLPLLAALKQHKKRKHKRAKRRSIHNEFIPDDEQTSTSETVLTKDVSCKSHRRRKRSHAPASSDNGDKMDSKKPHLAEHASSAADLPMDKKDDKDAPFASPELPSSCVNSVAEADKSDSKNCADPNERVNRHFDLLTRGLREVTVQLWDDVGMPNRKATQLPCVRTNSIGYVPDQWDEEYDRGKRKKVRKPKEEEFGGPNPFQETADIRSRQRKRLKSDQGRWGN